METAIPRHNYVDLATNPTELAGEHALKSPEKKMMLSKKLDTWVKSVRADAQTLTPDVGRKAP